MKNPKISIIVPVYNVEQYLPRCIDSILAQTFTDFEVLLIDDGSKDKSGAICDEYVAKDSRIRVFHKPNGGVSSARNIGLDNARGEYICFSDADDFVETNWLSCFFLNMKKNDMVISGFRIFKNGQLTDDVRMPISNDKLQIIQNLEERSISGYLWCKCFRKEIIDNHKIRFNEKFVIWEDMDFVYRYWCYSSKIELIGSNCTYDYNMPDFQEKYGANISFDSCFHLMKSSYRIFKEKNFVCKKYRGVARSCIKQSFNDGHFARSLKNTFRFVMFDFFRKF